MQRFTRQIVFVTTIFFFTGMPTLGIACAGAGRRSDTAGAGTACGKRSGARSREVECRRQFPNLSTVRDGPGFR
jgi:hypothetical protein